MTIIRAADLFCGAGGASNGLVRAAAALGIEVDLLAVNHWPIAVETHSRNHPTVRHMCEAVERIDPREAIPGGRLHLLMAGPECTHFSTARGGRPVNVQSRASAWHILKWAQELYIDNILIENVPEFRTWGPIGANNKPLKSKRGETYRAFLEALRSLGYKVEDKILNAADYGDPTTRQRLFIMARRGRHAISWPAPSHSRTGAATLFGKTQRWKAARDVIDWSVQGKSIFGRKKPLRPATMARIMAGLRKFGGPSLQPFLVMMEHGGRVGSVDVPLPTITTAKGGAIAIAQPFLVQFKGTAESQIPRTAKSVDEPVGTLTGSGADFGVVEPFLVTAGGPIGQGRTPVSIDAPLPTVLAENHRALVQAFVLGQQSGSVARSVDQPLPTIATDGAVSVVEPFIMPVNHGAKELRTRSLSDPLPTLTARANQYLVEPFIASYYGTTNISPASDPVPTVTTKDRFGLVQPFVLDATRPGPDDSRLKSVDAPLGVVTGSNRFALVQPVIDGYVLDIHFRMLKPHELAAAMSFPRSYAFAGNREDTVKQIGNAWPGEVAFALCREVLKDAAAAGKRTPRKKIA